MKFRPLHDRVLVQRMESEDKTAGGIIIPDTAKEKPMEGKVIAVASLLQNNGGWKRHIGRISQSILPKYRQKGIAGKLVQELVDIARMAGLQKVEAEFIDKQEGGQKLFALLGFTHLMRLEDYVQDMQAIQHDYVLMGMDLKTDEEYAGMG